MKNKINNIINEINDFTNKELNIIESNKWFEGQTKYDRDIDYLKKLKEYKKYKYSNAFTILFGLVFMLFPMNMVLPSIKNGETQSLDLMPIFVIIGPFVIIGLFIVIKSIKRMIKATPETLPAIYR